MLTNCPVSSEQDSVTGTGHRPFTSSCNSKGEGHWQPHRTEVTIAKMQQRSTYLEHVMKRGSCHLGPVSHFEVIMKKNAVIQRD